MRARDNREITGERLLWAYHPLAGQGAGMATDKVVSVGWEAW
jgi:hypothetical protein